MLSAKLMLLRKILAPMKKIGTPPPAPPKIGAVISGPRIAGKKLYGHEDFSELLTEHFLRVLFSFFFSPPHRLLPS